MRSDDLVRGLYERYRARDWVGATALLHPHAQLRVPATEQHLVGREQVIALQRDHPEPWGRLQVLRVVADATTAVAEVEVVGEREVLRWAAFWTVQEDLLLDGVEHWVTVGGDQPPPDRTGATG